jgi:hypothetical protein
MPALSTSSPIEPNRRAACAAGAIVLPYRLAVERTEITEIIEASIVLTSVFPAANATTSRYYIGERKREEEVRHDNENNGRG